MGDWRTLLNNLAQRNLTTNTIAVKTIEEHKNASKKLRMIGAFVGFRAVDSKIKQTS